jgi:hypothetical protein
MASDNTWDWGADEGAGHDLDFDVLCLCDEALEVSRKVTKREHEVELEFLRAKDALEVVLQAIVKCSKDGIRGHATCDASGYGGKTRLIYATDPNERAHIEGLTGAVHCGNAHELILLWRALPGILARHIAACRADIKAAEMQKNALARIWHGSQTLQAFVQEVMPTKWKRALMRRALTDADLQDALAAAAATGDPKASTKLLCEQIDQAEEASKE